MEDRRHSYVLPIRDIVVFPIIVPLFVGRPRSLKAIEMAMLRTEALQWSPRRRLRPMTREWKTFTGWGCSAQSSRWSESPTGLQNSYRGSRKGQARIH